MTVAPPGPWAAGLADRLTLTSPTGHDTADHVLHGYGMTRLRELARTAVGIWRHPKIAPYEDYLAWAIDGAVDTLLAATEPPEPIELVHAALRSIRAETGAISRSHGSPDKHGPGRTHKSFIIFWWSVQRLDIPVDQIVDTIAVREILPHLAPKEREAVQALALCDNSFPRAAAYLGVTESVFGQRLMRARRRFAELWYAPDTPAGLWRRQHEVVDTDERRLIRRRTMYASLCKRNHGRACGCHYADRLEGN